LMSSASLTLYWSERTFVNAEERLSSFDMVEMAV
jgi:hypothetical protein